MTMSPERDYANTGQEMCRWERGLLSTSSREIQGRFAFIHYIWSSEVKKWTSRFQKDLRKDFQGKPVYQENKNTQKSNYFSKLVIQSEPFKYFQCQVNYMCIDFIFFLNIY